MKTVSIRLAVLVMLLTTLFTVAKAENFESRIKASNEAVDAETACEQAFFDAEKEALTQIEEFFNENEDVQYTLRLTDETETRKDRGNGKTICVYEGTWQANINERRIDLIGSEQMIDGEYHSSCSQPDIDDECWNQIIGQAKQDLRQQLAQGSKNSPAYNLQYLDFEGRERERYHPHRSDITVDGIFYFRVIEAHPGNVHDIHIYRKDQTLVTEAEPQPVSEKEPKDSQDNNLDFTVFYTWDRNNYVDHNQLGISSDRWGIGVWVNNRIGFSAFWGEDTVGIGDERDSVHNASGSYNTLGIGIGHRLFDTRAMTVENTIDYVDAQPYNASIIPDCDSCTPQSFESENYIQTTTNVKTNTHGINIGWMFTWKWLAREPNLNRWSSGFYLEAQL